MTDRKQLQPLELRPITSLPVGVCPKRPSEGIDRFFFSLEAENVLPVATGQKSGATASTLLPFRCPKTSQLMTTARAPRVTGARQSNGAGRHAMKSTVIKRSIVVAGHKTSVSLEDGFWNALKEIAGERDATISDLVAIIDADRQHANLSSAIRLFVLGFYRDQIFAPEAEDRRPNGREHGLLAAQP